MEEEEGEYMAALRGSKSKQWQANQAPSGGGGPISNSYYPGNLQNPASAGSNCFRCGQPGHWSRDCPMPQVPGGGNPAGNPTNPAPQKQCPCGGGLCIVRTSNTPRNPGRQFFVCPKPSEAGKCNFFEWCDAAPAQTTPIAVNAPEPELKCPSCGQPCAVLTAKTEKNNGRRFYKCQRNEGCNLFKWCDEVNASPGSKPSRTSYGGSEAYGGGGYGGGGYGDYRGGGGGYGGAGGYGGFSHQGGNPAPPWMSSGDPAATNKSGRACFKCGDPGHWANACPMGR